MLHETRAWIAAGETPRGAHHWANEALFEDPHAFAPAFAPYFYSEQKTYAFDATILPHLCQGDASSIWDTQVGIFLQWATVSGPEMDVNFWPHNKNTAIF